MRVRDIDDPDLPLSEILRIWPEVAEVFFRRGMLCVGCEIAPFHTVTDACLEYRLDEAQFRADLRRSVSRARNGRRWPAPADAGLEPSHACGCWR